MKRDRETEGLSPTDKRDVLEQLLQAATATSNLSSEQFRLWLLRQLDPNVPTQVFAATKIKGLLDCTRLEHAVKEVTQTHEVLQTSIVDAAGRPLRILAHTRPSLPVIDLTKFGYKERDQEMRRLAKVEARCPFDLTVGPLLRTTLLRLASDVYVLFVTMHQMVADEVSVDVFLHELGVSYGSNSASGRSQPNSRREFSEFVVWRRNFLQTGVRVRELCYWQTQLAALPVLTLPTDRPRPPICTHEGVTRWRTLSPDTLVSLRTLAHDQGTTLREVLLSAFLVLLARYSRQWDFAVGIRGDRISQWRDCIGPFANTHVLRAHLSPDQRFLELLRLTSETHCQARTHGITPFDELLDHIKPQRDLSHTPLFQVMFAFCTRNPVMSDPALKWTEVQVDSGKSLVDVTLTVTVGSDKTEMQLEGNANLFEAETLDRMLYQLALLLDNIAFAPQNRLSQFRLLSESDWGEVVARNDTSAPFSSGSCIHELVEEQVARTPEATAVLFDRVNLTYRELNERANQLAHYLRVRGVGREDPVGLYAKRSPEMIIALLAILKAGGAYVPLDPGNPPERLRFLLDNCRIKILLTEHDLLSGLPSEKPPTLLLDDAGAISASPRNNPSPLSTPGNLAYIIYTSGSTGKPKGVMLPHLGVVNNLCWRQHSWPLSTSDRVLQHCSFSFDPSVWTIFWPLMSGAAIVLVPEGEHCDPAALARRMAEFRVTVFGAAPSLHGVIIDELHVSRCTSLRYIFSGGEALNGELQTDILSRLSASLVNVYGPTEATIDALFWVCSHAQRSGDAPIGHPLPNVEVYVLDEQLWPVPVGVPGEILIAGAGLARGYLGRPDLTAERFVPNPFSQQLGTRIYRTGDIGRRRSDGAIEFLGRVDDQVKVRGFRIELGEVEAALRRHDEVGEVAVIAREDVPGHKRLIAYVSPSSSNPPSRDSLISFLEQHLPHYMVPREFEYRSRLPRTPSGKVDRNAMLAYEVERSDQACTFVAPRTPLEMEIALAFAAVLLIERVSIEDNFFDCGGDSLLAARLSSRLSSTYNVNLTVQQIFQDPTVAGIASTIEHYRIEGVGSLGMSWTFDDLVREATLDAAIEPGMLSPADITDPRQVLLTGATGYLGTFLLQTLLRETTADVFCLVRAADPDSAMQRIEAACRFYRIWDEAFRRRIQPVHGDLSKPLLGLSKELFNKLAALIDVVYHSGALVNFVYPYSALKAANVLGTQEVLRLACTAKLKAVHHISTIDVLLGTGVPRPFLENDEALERPHRLPDGYPRSKLVAERMVAIARRRGVPVCVYRPGLIMGHTRSGATPKNCYIFVGLKGYIELGVLPEDPNLFDVITVDYAARAIVFLSRQTTSPGKIFHLWNPRPIPTMRTYDWIRSFGYRLETVSRRVARERVLCVDESNALYPFVPHFQRESAEHEELSSFAPETLKAVDARLECRNTVEALLGSGISCPLINEQFAKRCLSFLVDVGFLPPPRRLPKKNLSESYDRKKKQAERTAISGSRTRDSKTKSVCGERVESSRGGGLLPERVGQRPKSESHKNVS
jgi:myxalamid-type nonribosomal peptide synthetase MxaA